jgi:peptidoglycan/xylan/chitin deacetylase (PgdA/CDA1 family)
MTRAYSPSRTPTARLMRFMHQAWPAKLAMLQFKRGIVSFTFDDAPQSATMKGAELLEAANARGTFYLSGGFTNQSTHLGAMHRGEDIERLRRTGHEIGCHSFSHGDGARTKTHDTIADIERNTKALAACGVDAPCSYAYPYGESQILLKRKLATRFQTARGIRSGLNSGLTDLMQLRAQRLYGEDTSAQVSALLHRASRTKCWAIIFTHDVEEHPTPFGCTPIQLAHAIAQAQALGLEILPVREALQSAER